MSGEIISVAEMAAIDVAAAAAGTPTRTLMENAGQAVAHAIAQKFSPRTTAVLCGPGNNGGDGWVVARALQELGWPVSVYTLTPRENLKGDAAAAASAWSGDVHALDGAPPQADLYVDALFGAGLSRPLEGVAALLAAALSNDPARVVAIDVPSGLDGDSGKALGEVCFISGLTVTFVRKKPAHVLLPGRGLCGEIIVADIGVPESIVGAQAISLWENHPGLWWVRFPWPQAEAHKHARGHAMVASGAHTRTGAARLAARAALRIGAGLVTVLSPLDALAENAAHLTAVMLQSADSIDAFAEAARAAQALIIGPAFGVTDTHEKWLHAAIGASGRCPLVLDADAITLLAPMTHALSENDVLTPHVGEFRRAFPGLLSNTASRIEAARAAAAYARCVVLLKGPYTVIAAPDGRAIVNTTGSPFLATAGSGDVLAGLIGGLVAQGMSGFEAAAAGAWIHGKAGEALGPGLIAEDLPEILPATLSALHAWREPTEPDSGSGLSPTAFLV